VGSNVERATNRTPRALCFGGAISQEQIDQVKQALFGHSSDDDAWKKEVKFVSVPRAEMAKLMGDGPPKPEISGGFVKKSLNEIYGRS
jgi:hypothetical protein